MVSKPVTISVMERSRLISYLCTKSVEGMRMGKRWSSGEIRPDTRQNQSRAVGREHIIDAKTV